MQNNRYSIITKVHLALSVIVVIPAGIIYAFFPEMFLNLNVASTDENNLQKAIMGLYFGFSTLWLIGIIKNSYLRAALVSNAIFMLGLGGGRILSLFIDGIPSTAYVLGTIGELVLGLYGFWILTQLKKEEAPH